MSIEVDLSGLEEFAGKVHEAVTTGLRPAQDASADLMMTTGKSGIPGAATLFNWNSRVFYMTTVHNGRMASGGAALGLAASSVAAAYSDSDGSATAQMGAVQDAFYPRSDAYSLDDVLAEDAAAAAEREAAQQQAIQDAAAEVEFVHDGSTGTDSAFVGPPPAGSAQEASNAIAANAHLTELGLAGGYEAPAQTPQELLGTVPGSTDPNPEYCPSDEFTPQFDYGRSSEISA